MKLFPTGAPSAPGTVAGMVIALLSDAAEGMVGQTVYCSGGFNIGEYWKI